MEQQQVPEPVPGPSSKPGSVNKNGKPRAAMKKVPDEEKDAKYWETREKNRLASRRCREQNAAKINAMIARASELELENDHLDERIGLLKRAIEANKEYIDSKKSA